MCDREVEQAAEAVRQRARMAHYRRQARRGTTPTNNPTNNSGRDS